MGKVAAVVHPRRKRRGKAFVAVQTTTRTSLMTSRTYHLLLAFATIK
jgi:hypothetical protein